MRTIKGTIELNGREYDYGAQVGERDIDYIPDHITDIDPADGSILPDDIDYEKLEDAATENLALILWCERNGFEETDTGGGCYALIRNSGGVTTIITKANDCAPPQTLKEPVVMGRYDETGRPISGISRYEGGIDSAIHALL